MRNESDEINRSEHEALLERDAELAAIDRLLADAVAGRGAVGVIEGPAGIGKTALLQAARGIAAERGIRVLGASGATLERDYAFGVAQQLLVPALASASPRERGRWLSGAARLAEQALEPVDVPEAQAGRSPSFALLHGLYWLTMNISAEQPLALLVDDAHWSDVASLRFLHFFGRRLNDARGALILARRAAEPSPATQLLGELASEAGVRRIQPAPLSEPAVSELVRQSCSEDAASEFCSACYTATAGNPFSLRALLAEVASEAIPATAAAARDVRRLIPDDVMRAVLIRISRQEPGCSAVARAVAVLGDRAELRHVAALAGLDRGTAASAAQTLTAADVLARGHPLVFVHPLIRNAIYADTPEAERAVAHEAAARLLLDEGAAPEQVAAHLLLSEPAGDPMVVGALEQAAGRARVRGAHEAAVTYLRRALLEPPTSDRRAAVLRALGSAEAGAGEPLTVEHLREALDLTGDPRERAAVSLDLAFALNSQLRAPEAVEVLDAAASDVAELDPQFALRLLAEQAGTGQLDRRTAALVADRIDGRFEALTGATPEERLMLASVAYLKAASVPIEAGELAERAFARGLLADQGSECVPVHQAIWALLVAERYELALRILDEALADAQSRGSEIGFAITGSLRCELAWRAGALADAIAEGQAALAVTRALGWTLPSALAYLILCLLERGELDSAVVELDSSHLDRDLPDHLLFNSLLCARGKLRIEQGLLEEGIRDLLALDERERWQRNGESTLRFRSVSLPWRSYAALALGGDGRHADAVQLAQEECRLAHDTELTRPYGIALRTLGLLHSGSVGIDYLRRSVKTLENSPARLEYARALTDLGSALRRDRQRAEARAPLRAGMKLARALDARPLAQRAHDELAASGEHVQRLNYLGRDQLTPSEMRIAKLAAEGRTNREIAQSLFLSQKTIEMHLRHAYQKLDISSRHQLPRALGDVTVANPGSPPSVR